MNITRYFYFRRLKLAFIFKNRKSRAINSDFFQEDVQDNCYHFRGAKKKWLDEVKGTIPDFSSEK